MKKLGICVRADNGGLASISEDFVKYLQPEKTLVALGNYENHLEKFKGGIVCDQLGIPTNEQIDKFLEGLDVILTFETPYNWNLFKKAKEKGIKTILVPNYEWTTAKAPIEPDLYACPSKLDYDIFKGEGKNAVYMPIPIDREKIPFKLRRQALKFVFNNGHGGSMGRNSAREMMEAISMVKMPHIEFIIRSQVQIENSLVDNRVHFGGETRRENLYEEGDVFIFPHKFDGLSLPIQEAMASGMPIIATDFYPYNEILPKELLIKPDGIGQGKLCENCRTIDIHFISPRVLAEKINEIAGKDITELSKQMNRLAEEISWNKLKDKWQELINQ